MFNTPDGCPDIWNEDNCECPECGANMYIELGSTVLECSECEHEIDTRAE